MKFLFVIFIAYLPFLCHLKACSKIDTSIISKHPDGKKKEVKIVTDTSEILLEYSEYECLKMKNIKSIKSGNITKYQYNCNGEKSSIAFICNLNKEGEEDGISTRFHRDGITKKEEFLYKNGGKDGIFYKWYENGTIKMIGYYRNDQIDDKWKYYDENGYLTGEENYLLGLKQGLLLGFSVKGDTTFLETYQQGETMGRYCIWYDGNPKQKETEGCLFKRVVDGKWTEWYENGKKKSENYFDKGVPIGISKYYNINGQLIKAEVYKEGKLIELNEYDDNGKLR